MNKRSKSIASSKNTSRVSKSTLADDLIDGFRQAIAHNREEIRLRTRQIYVFDDVDIKAIRQKSGLSQNEFALLYGFNPRTLQQWEQGRNQPDQALRAYLTLIGRDPTGVARTLRSTQSQEMAAGARRQA